MVPASQCSSANLGSQKIPALAGYYGSGGSCGPRFPTRSHNPRPQEGTQHHADYHRTRLSNHPSTRVILMAPGFWPIPVLGWPL